MFTTFASMSGHQFMCDICFETHNDPHHYCEEMRYDDRFADPQQIESNFIDMFVSVSRIGNTEIGGKLMWISDSGFKDHAEAEAAMADSDVVSQCPCGCTYGCTTPDPEDVDPITGLTAEEMDAWWESYMYCQSCGATLPRDGGPWPCGHDHPRIGEEPTYHQEDEDVQIQIESNLIDMFVSVPGFTNTEIGGQPMWIADAGLKDRGEAVGVLF